MAADSDQAATRPRISWSFFLGAALLALVLRLAFSLGYWTDQPLTRDEREYLSLARSLSAGHGFVYDEDMQGGSFLPFGRAPGYPTFLALTGGGRAPIESVPPSVKVAQSVVGAIGVLLVGLIAGRLGGDGAARIAAIIAACYPPLVWISAYALSEALFWPVGLAAAWLFDRANGDEAGGGRWAIAAGLLVGVGILIRPALLLFLPLGAAWMLWRRRPALALTLIVGALLIVTPWTLRNYRHHGKLVVVASDGGVTFWTGNHPLAIGEGDMAANPALKLDNQALRARHPGLSEEQMEPIYYREALTWIRQHPTEWLILELRKVFYTVVPLGPSYTLHSRLYFLTSVLSYGLVLPFAIGGLRRLGRRAARGAGLWCLAASAIATCLVFFPQERFRIPVIDPALVICAGAAIARTREVA